MNRAALIAWWTDRIDAAGKSIGDAQARRRRLDEDIGRARGVAPGSPQVARAHEILRGETITGQRDEERLRRLHAPSGGGGGGGTAARTRARSSPMMGSGTGSGGGPAIGRARQLAAGYQPAVVKIVSYARGVTRATATGQYVLREGVP